METVRAEHPELYASFMEFQKLYKKALYNHARDNGDPEGYLERKRAAGRSYYWNGDNRVRAIARQREWRESMPEDKREAYLARHAERNRAYRAARKAAKAEADVTKA